MRRLKVFASLIAFVSIICVQKGLAQDVVVPVYNPNSVSPIAKYEHLYKVTVWKRVDLKEKQNKGFFAKNQELSKIIIEAVRSGEINHIYANDSLTTEITKEEFLSRLNLYEEMDAEEYYDWDDLELYYGGDACTFNGVNYESLQDDNEGNSPDSSPEFWTELVQEADTYTNSEISLMEIREDVIFDKRRSRLYYDMQSIKLYVPGSVSVEGFNKELGTFSYKELESFFRRRPDIAIWYNQYNSAENKNLADAFLLRVFHGNIFKVENPDDLSINQIYNKTKKEGMFAAEWMEMQIMEKEHNLWSY